MIRRRVKRLTRTDTIVATRDSPPIRRKPEGSEEAFRQPYRKGFKMLAKNWIVGIVVAASIAGAGVALALSTRDSEPLQGGALPEIGLAQTTTAESAGILASVAGARFSGTGSFVDLTLDASALRLPPGSALRIPAEALNGGTLFALDPVNGVELRDSRRTIVRLKPLIEGQSPVLHFTAVDVLEPGVGAKRIQGNWTLTIEAPPDLAAQLLRTELKPGPEVSSQGVTVRPLAGVRSTTEVLVTVEILGPPGIGHLISPHLVGSEPRIYGARVEGPESSVLTFSFPPPPEGKAFSIEMGPLIAPGEKGESAHVDIALGDLLARQGVKGAFKDKAAIDQRDLIGGSPGAPRAFGLQFAATAAGIAANVLNLRLEGSYSDLSAFSLTLSDGSVLAASGMTSYSNVAPTGTLTQSASTVGFDFTNMEQLRGNVRLAIGSPSKVLRGSWLLTFQP